MIRIRCGRAACVLLDAISSTMLFSMNHLLFSMNHLQAASLVEGRERSKAFGGARPMQIVILTRRLGGQQPIHDDRHEPPQDIDLYVTTHQQ